MPANDVDTSAVPDVPCRSPDRVFGRAPEPEPDAEGGPNVNPPPWWHPHANPTISRLLRWHHCYGHSKSKGSLNRLVQDVILQPDFEVDHLEGFSAKRETDVVYNNKTSSKLPFQGHDGWIKSEVEVKLPRARNRVAEKDAPAIHVDNVWYRNPFDVIKTEMAEPYSAQFHLKPHKLFWRNPTDPSSPVQRVYGEGYTSDRMLEFEREIMAKLHPRPEGSPEVGIAGIMLYSDSTQLANFGEASLWPAYLTFGNWSKYDRLKPSTLAMNHVIYFPSLPKTVQDHYKRHFGQLASEAELRFCKVELLHAVWHLLVSDERFVDAYINGYLKKCTDGVLRLLFYRFLCYSTDYVEKVILACIKYLSTHPCPLCMTRKDQVHLLGTKADMNRHSVTARSDNDELLADIAAARSTIFARGYAINNQKHVQNHLEDTSTLPVRSAFSKLFQAHGLNHYEMYVPDSFHDLTGRISDLLKHNVRILSVQKKPNIEVLDQRFRQVPTFGSGTIRRFKNSVSSFTKFAGRDYQDALECAMPCFEGLFLDELDEIIQDLLFTFATYERYCNLRQHTDSTINTMKSTTSELGRHLRRYKDAVSGIATVESKHERQARLKRDPNGDKGSRRKAFSLVNYKTHALGHEADTIMKYGTTDGTSTQPVSMVQGEREHRRVKNKYQVTNKNRPEGQIGALVLVERKLASRNNEVMPHADPSVHHQFPINQNNSMKLYNVMSRKYSYDPALKDFATKLQRHLISRILDVDPDSVPDKDLYRLGLVGERFYRHQRFRLHYTTYDCRRKKESIGFRRSPHIMMLTGDPSDPHPYLYTRVIGIYHANVLYTGAGPVHGKMRHPARVIRVSHMIPAYEYSTVQDILPKDSLARMYEDFYEGKYVKEEKDWRYFYVNLFPDMDMFMRYRGGGIGHIEFHEFLRALEKEATANDVPLPVYDDNGNVVQAPGEGENAMDEDDAQDKDEDEVEDEVEDEETLEDMYNRGMAIWDDAELARESDSEDSGSDFD
ncbi:hypothetical protein PM082_023903 [Marasmius tenuissimus]|nr:hypothetical protein PM082_023903 [Marasmius tenuissimus]